MVTVNSDIVPPPPPKKNGDTCIGRKDFPQYCDE